MTKHNKNFLILLVLLIIVQVIWLILSPGFYYIDDGCHYVYNRHFYQMPDLIISSWARVGRVLLYALPAQINYRAVQILSALIFDLTAVIGYKILKFKNIPNPEWALIAIGFQPVLFNISYTALAELPTAFLIILSFYLFIREKYFSAVIISSLTFLFRTEYFFVCGLFVLILLFRKKWYAVPLALIGPLIWFLIVWKITGNPSDFIRVFGLHSQLPRAGSGIHWYHFIIYSPKTFGIFQTLFFLIALVILIIRKNISGWILPLLIIIGGIAGHTFAALDEFNATCSTGQIRYIAVVGPMLGLFSAAGIGYFYSIFKSKALEYPMFVLLALLLFLNGPFLSPLHSKYEIDKVCENISLLHDKKYPGYPVMTDLFQLSVAFDMPYSDYGLFHKMRKSSLKNLEKAYIVWETSLDGTPFTDSDLMLRDLQSDTTVQMIDSIRIYADHTKDFPVYNIFNVNDGLTGYILNYLTFGQNINENTDVKIFLKSRGND